jgi:transposase
MAFLKTLRRRLPDQRLHLILDNFSPHKHRSGMRDGAREEPIGKLRA